MIDPAELVETVGDDPEVRDAIKKLILDSVDMAQELLAQGSPTVKMQVMNRLLPAAVKIMGNQREQDELKKMQVALSAMMKEMRGETELVADKVDNVVHVTGGDGDGRRRRAEPVYGIRPIEGSPEDDEDMPR